MGVDIYYFCPNSSGNDKKLKEDFEFSIIDSLVSTNFHTDSGANISYKLGKYPVQVEKAVKYLMSSSFYKLLFKKINFEQYVKVKLKGFETSFLYDILTILTDEIITIQNKELLSRKTRLINDFLLLNFKRPLIALKNNFTNNEEINSLFLYIIYVVLELHHYIKRDIYTLIPQSSNEIYKENYWKNEKVIYEYFKWKIFFATNNLMKIKNFSVDYIFIEINEDNEDEDTRKRIFLINKFLRSIYK